MVEQHEKADAAYTKALNRISECAALRRNYIELGGLGLSILPPEIGQLRDLTTMYLMDNKLTELPPEIGKLTALKKIFAMNNQLTSLPDEIRDLTHLELLFLHNNPALQLSPLVLGPDPSKESHTFATAKSILDFYFGRKMEATRPLNEVKLILVGRGGAGKTSTVRALLNQPFREGEESTPGIALCDWSMNDLDGGPVTAHVWDFAGQIITHALHQFFFSVRSVYILVLSGRENYEREDAEYWLRLIKAFGTDNENIWPPVIVALNKWELAGCRARVDRGALQERYPFIRGFVEIDCKSCFGVAELRAAVCSVVDNLEWVREPIPETWDAVRRNLTKGPNPRPHLTFAEFRTLCVKNGVGDKRTQESLSELLHNLGAALNYRTDPRLREATVLQPEWLTSNVYNLVRRAEMRQGELLKVDVDEVLSNETDRFMREYLIQIMERFEIAYAGPSTAGVWLIPQSLPDNQPVGVAAFRNATVSTRSRYVYPVLPEGLVARAIVRLHEFIEEVDGQKQQWGSGAILIRGEARALIRTEPQDRQIMITVIGSTKNCQQLAGLCQAVMRDINNQIPGLDPIEETLIQGSWVATKTLEADEKLGRMTGVSTAGGTINVDPAGANNAYSVPPARLDGVWKPTVFISYSKRNVQQRKRLESELKILKNEGLLASAWHDRMIDPGETWDETIQRKLTEADVVVLLMSSDALATDYITQHEIPKALELHNATQAVVVPVILEACRWAETPLSSLNALPEKAVPLNKWNPRSDGWNSIANGLSKVLQKVMATSARPSANIK